MNSDESPLKPKHSKNLLELTKAQKIKFLNSFHTVLISGEGSLWNFWGPIQYAGYAVALLKKMEKKVIFMTDNGMRTEEELMQMLQAHGIDGIKVSDFITPISIMINYIHRVMPGKPVFSLCDPRQNVVLQNAGVKVKSMTPILNLTMETLGTQLPVEDRVAAVIMDVNLNISMSELICAQQYLENRDCALIYGSDSPTLQLTENITTIGPGCFVNLLKDTSGKDPISIQSGNIINSELVERFSITKPSRYLFIGNSIDPDIELANHCGFRSILILSGSKQPKDLDALRPLQRPTFTLEKLSEFVDFMSSLN